MKTLFTLLLAFVLAGCGTITDTIYGPDLTPAELQDAIYEDAFSIGVIMASREGADANKILKSAETLRGLANPGEAIRLKWLEFMRDGDTENAMLFFAARRLYARLGAKIVGDQLTSAGLDSQQFNFALDAFIEGVKSLKE